MQICVKLLKYVTFWITGNKKFLLLSTHIWSDSEKGPQAYWKTRFVKSHSVFCSSIISYFSHIKLQPRFLTSFYLL